MNSRFFYFLLACLLAGCVIELNGLLTGKHPKMIKQKELSFEQQNKILKDSIIVLNQQNDSLQLELKSCKITNINFNK